MAADQKELQLLVRREFARRPLDLSQVDIYANHGVVYLRGTIRVMRGHSIDLRQELSILENVLKQKPQIRDVINELQLR